LNCPACQSSDTEKSGIIHKFKYPLHISKCKRCSTSFQDPLPKDPDAYYDKAYYNGTADFSYTDERKFFQGAQHVWKARLKKIHSYVKEGKFLDVGCSFGGFAYTAGKYYDSYGLDISQFAIESAYEYLSQKTGEVPVLKKGQLTNFPKKSFPQNGFSIITMIEVIEHLKNPKKHIEKAYELLKPGGVLVIQTANMEARQAQRQGLDYHYFLPGHCTCFSATGLQEMLSQTGFQHFQSFIPVDFGLLPKLRKMKTQFNHPLDALKWIRTSLYHFKSYFRYKGIPLTSSYVLYAFK